jgi:hypothetical protein
LRGIRLDSRDQPFPIFHGVIGFAFTMDDGEIETGSMKLNHFPGFRGVRSDKQDRSRGLKPRANFMLRVDVMIQQ